MYCFGYVLLAWTGEWVFLMLFVFFFFFKQKTAYEMRISDWSSDVCSSDLFVKPAVPVAELAGFLGGGVAVWACAAMALLPNVSAAPSNSVETRVMYSSPFV